MKIIFTSDNHVLPGDSVKVKNMIGDISSQKPDVLCNCGDLCEVLISPQKKLVNLLLNTINPTIYVPGNHDLYSIYPITPPKALEECIKRFKGIPLQPTWDDHETFFLKDDILFLGTIGFPDFAHPRLLHPLSYYNYRFATVDYKYINLSSGWICYTQPILDAFHQKLQLLKSIPCKDVVILTHYSVFDGQYYSNFSEDVSAYFFCYSIGQMIKEVAVKFPNKRFFCVSGHGHKFNMGKWVQEGYNVFAYGIVTDYFDQNFITLDINIFALH